LSKRRSEDVVDKAVLTVVEERPDESGCIQHFAGGDELLSAHSPSHLFVRDF